MTLCSPRRSVYHGAGSDWVSAILGLIAQADTNYAASGFAMTSSPQPVPPTRSSRLRMGGLFALGLVTDFLDTLGVGSFATTTTVLRLGRLVDDEQHSRNA